MFKLLGFVVASLEFVRYLFERKDRLEEDKEAEALYAARKGLFQRDRDRASRRARRIDRAGVLKEEAIDLRTSSGGTI